MPEPHPWLHAPALRYSPWASRLTYRVCSLLGPEWATHAFGPLEDDAKSSYEDPNPKRAVGGIHKAFTRHLTGSCDRTTDRSFLSTVEIGDGSKDAVPLALSPSHLRLHLRPPPPPSAFASASTSALTCAEL